MPKLIDDSNENRKSIEKALIRYKDGATINQISKDLGLSWITVKRHLEYLNAIGRIHVKKFGNNEIYFLNGEGKWKKQIELSPSHTLFLDTFVSPFNELFLRIKETKIIDGKWKSMGNIIITKEKLSDVIDFLKQLEAEIG